MTLHEFICPVCRFRTLSSDDYVRCPSCQCVYYAAQSFKAAC